MKNAHVWDDSKCNILGPANRKVMFMLTSELQGSFATTFLPITRSALKKMQLVMH